MVEFNADAEAKGHSVSSRALEDSVRSAEVSRLRNQQSIMGERNGEADTSSVRGRDSGASRIGLLSWVMI